MFAVHVFGQKTVAPTETHSKYSPKPMFPKLCSEANRVRLDQNHFLHLVGFGAAAFSAGGAERCGTVTAEQSVPDKNEKCQNNILLIYEIALRDIFFALEPNRNGFSSASWKTSSSFLCSWPLIKCILNTSLNGKRLLHVIHTPAQRRTYSYTPFCRDFLLVLGPNPLRARAKLINRHNR